LGTDRATKLDASHEHVLGQLTVTVHANGTSRGRRGGAGLQSQPRVSLQKVKLEIGSVANSDDGTELQRAARCG
jgi:hypothetical protein